MGKEEGSGGAIPVIDMAEIPFPYMKLREVCEDSGCFRVVNHRVPLSLMSEMKSVPRSLLDLPVEVKKLNNGTAPGSMGYIGHGEKNPMYESLGLYDVATPEALDGFCSKLDVSSQQREIVKRYMEAVTDLAAEVAEKLARGMGLKGSDCFKGWPCRFRINKYSFSPETVGSLGLGIHTDPGLITILQDDEVVSGLEVADSSGSFIHVDRCPGSFVVNLGDMAVAWSNGKLQSVKHRVNCKEAAVRISIGGFVGPPNDLAVVAPEELVDCDNPRLYVPITYDEYKQVRSNNNMPTDEALSLLLAKS